MQLSHSHKFIFIHVFKTGGTSIRAGLERFLNRPQRRLCNRVRRRLGWALAPDLLATLLPHARAIDVRAVLPPRVFDSYFKFAFVRNPWDWQVSFYSYILQNPDHHEHTNVSRLRSFEEFIRYRTDRPVWSQKSFVTDEKDGWLVDFVGRFENLQADFAQVCARTRINATLPHLNDSRRADYRVYYDDRTVAAVREQCREDVECFGYEFDKPGYGRETAPVFRPADHDRREASAIYPLVSTATPGGKL